MLPSSTSSWQTFRQYHDSDFLAIGKSTFAAKKVAEATFFATLAKTLLVKVIPYPKRIARARRPFLGSRMPLQSIKPMATPLGADPAELLRAWMDDYFPGLVSALQELGDPPPLSASERRLLQALRVHTEGGFPEKRQECSGRVPLRAQPVVLFAAPAFRDNGPRAVSWTSPARS